MSRRASTAAMSWSSASASRRWPQEALGQARFEIAAADRLDFLGRLHAAWSWC